jgi:hypothetical protein
MSFFAITYDPHDLHGCLPAANIANSLGEGSLVDEAELEGVAAHLDEVVEEGAEAGQRVRRAEQGHVPELARSTRVQNTISVGVPTRDQNKIAVGVPWCKQFCILFIRYNQSRIENKGTKTTLMKMIF